MFQMQLHDTHGTFANKQKKEESCRLDMDPRHSRRSVRFGDSSENISPDSKKIDSVYKQDEDSEDPSEDAS